MQETLPSREKWSIVGVLGILTIAAWVVTIDGSRTHVAMDGMARSAAAPRHGPPTVSAGPAHGEMMMPGMPVGSAATAETSTALVLGIGLFLSMWVAMMVARMFPSVYPIMLLFARISKGQAGPSGPDTGADLDFRRWLSGDLDADRRRDVSGTPRRALGDHAGQLARRVGLCG